MHSINIFFLILIWSIANSQCMGYKNESAQKELGENIDTLIGTFTKEEMHGMIEIIEFLKLKNPSFTSTEGDEPDNSRSFPMQEDDSAPINEKEIYSLSKLGLSESDIEELVEIAKVMKVSPELSRYIESSTGDDLIEMSEMTPRDLKLLENKLTLSELANKKVITRREAEPEPEPEAEPEPVPEPYPEPDTPTRPPKLLTDYYHPYALSRMRVKRSKSGLKLRLKGKSFGKGRYRRMNPPRKQPSFQHQQDHMVSVMGGRGVGPAERSYGMVGEHKGRYGRDLWASADGDENNEIVDNIVADDREIVASKKSRKRRHIMEAVMGMLGMKEDEEESEEVLYMSAMMDGHKHEVMKTPSYRTPESFKKTMARAKLVKTYP